MVRKFNGNNFMKGRISWQLPQFVESGAIKFEAGEKRNTCIISVDEPAVDQMNLKYLYKVLLPLSREIKTQG